MEAFYQQAIAQLGRAGLGATLMHVGFSQMLDGLLRTDLALFMEGWSRLRSGDDYLCYALKTEDSEEPAASIMAALCKLGADDLHIRRRHWPHGGDLPGDLDCAHSLCDDGQP